MVRKSKEMKNDWIECSECGEEYKIISPSIEEICYCPYCGNHLEIQESEDDESL